MAKRKESGSQPPFEKAIEQIEQIVDAMESDQLPLDDLIKKYEEGTRLLTHCQSKIEAAQKRVDIIMSDRKGGAKLESFDETGEPSSPTGLDDISEEESADDEESETEDEIRLF